MKVTFSILAITAALLTVAGSPTAHAQFTADTYFTSEDQVLTTGTEVWGGRANYGGGDFDLSDGVSFDTQFAGGVTYAGTSLSGITVRTDGAYRDDYTGVSAFSDSALNNVLTYDISTGGVIFDIAGLTSGDTYTVQFFSAMTNNGDYTSGGGAPVESGTLPIANNTSGGTSTISFGQTYDAVSGTYSGTGVYTVTDTFVAGTDGTQNFYITSPSGSVAQLAAADIRLVPEPSTYAMLLGGVALLGLIVRRKALQSV
jgi:hypothetical protein